MLTVAAIAPPWMAWRAVWDNISQSGQLICCATVVADLLACEDINIRFKINRYLSLDILMYSSLHLPIDLSSQLSPKVPE